MRALSMFVFALLGLSGLSTAAALTPPPAQGPPCVLPHNGNPPFKYLWGGDLREVCVWTNPSNPSHHRVWVSEDGGRIRFFDSTVGSWVFQNVPSAPVLLDIYFLQSGPGAGETGWAVGKGGVVLRTDNHGNTWTQIATEYQSPGVPGVLWGVCFRNQNEGWLAAEHFLRRTENGGVTWTATVNVNNGVGCTFNPSDLEYYAVDFIEVGGALRAICGAEPGIILYTDNGRDWFPAHCLLGSDFEPWDVSFEPNPVSVATARVYVAGGPGATAGEIHSSSDGGANWILEHSPANVIYGIEAMPNGGGLACAYGGDIYKRNAIGTWSDVSNHIPNVLPGTSLFYTAPLNGVDSDGNNTAWIVGSFGHLRKSISGGAVNTWMDDIPYTQLRMWRLNEIHFVDDLTGWIAGQHRLIAKTTNGGCKFTVQFGGQGSGQPSANLTGLAFASPIVGLAVGVDGGIVYTANGDTWSVPSVPPTMIDYNAVAWNGGGYFFVVGEGGLVARLDISGLNWTTIPAPPGNPDLRGIAFVNQNGGFAVGNVGGTGKAYRLVDATTNPSWIDVSPVFGLTGSRWLTGVATRGVLPSAEVYAVGNQGVILKWKRTADKFETVPGAYQVDGSGNPTFQLSHQDNLCVELPAGNTTIFVGSKNQDEFSSEEGKIPHFNGTNWTTLKCQTTKGIFDFAFPLPGFGYGVGHANTAQATGNVGDSSLVIFKP